MGKTSLSKALCEQLDVDMLFINASNNRGIDEVRTTLNTFASSSSLFGKKKVVLLDEADNRLKSAESSACYDRGVPKPLPVYPDLQLSSQPYRRYPQSLYCVRLPHPW